MWPARQERWFFFSALEKPYLKCYIQCWPSQAKKDTNTWEPVLWNATMIAGGLQHMTGGEAKSWDSLPLGREASERNLSTNMNTWFGGYKENKAEPFSIVSSGRIRGKGHKYEIEEFQFKHLKKIVRVIHNWSRLPREAVCLHPWRYSKPSWVWLWVICSSWTCFE